MAPGITLIIGGAILILCAYRFNGTVFGLFTGLLLLITGFTLSAVTTAIQAIR